MGLALAGLGHNVTDPRTRADDVADQIIDGARRGDVVVVCPDQLGPALTRALDQDEATLDVVRYPDLGDARFVDWRDYEERSEAASPARVARRLVARADGAHVWVVWNGSYRTFDGQCESLIDNHRARIGVATPDREYEGAFETSHVIRFG
jgi:mannosyltransferase